MSTDNKALYIFLLFLSLFITAGAAGSAKDEYYISGIVRDSLTLEPLPFASVTVSGQANGTLTNDKGIFELTIPNNTTEIAVTCLGYDRITVPIRKGAVNLYDVLMSPSVTELHEVVVRRPKYKKKNNPAVEFVNRLKKAGTMTDPRRNDYYNYNKHELMTFGLNNFVEKDENSWLTKKFPFIWEHVDTSEISGKPVLNVIVDERVSDVHYRKNPRTSREIITGQRHDGIDEVAEQSEVQTFLKDVLREIDLYDNDLTLLQNKFVSPLSKIAPDFYKFYLTDTVEIDNEKCIVLSFYPHNQAAFGFNGQIYVPANDSTMFIRRVTMRTPRNINLNFIDNLYISQEFKRAPDGSRLKVRDDMTIEASIVSGLSGFYVRHNIAYDNHNFDAPTDQAVFDYVQKEVTASDATTRSEEFWDSNRLLQVTDNEKRVDTMMERLRKVPAYYWTEMFLKIFIKGYVPTASENSKFDIGPMNTTFSFSDVEGMRLRAGGMTTANLSKRWFGRGYAAYGTKDHRWKYNAEVEYSFIDKDYHSREFPVHSIRLTSKYDVDYLGQHYLFTNQDNMFLSFKRMKNYQATYQRLNKIDYTLELYNNFSVVATLQNEQQQATPWMTFVDGYGNTYRNYTENTLAVQLRYAPGEKFYQTKTHRIPINDDAPVITLVHTFGPKDCLGSKYMINKTELSFKKRVWVSAFGFIDAIAKGGHVWSVSPYPNLLIPNANLSYTIQKESFALMNPMEFINDSFASWDVTYWLNGALFNYIPLVKKLKLREAVAFRGLWGHLSKRNDPDCNPDLFRFPEMAHVTRMTDRPYMEIAAGVDNLFKCLRVDYVWRLSYLDVPYEIDRHGLRVAFHVTF